MLGQLLRAFVFGCFGVLLLIGSVAFGQGETVVVPDLTGLNLPQAAAELNRNQLALGAQVNEAWTEAAGVPLNAIGAQSVAAGEAVAVGSRIDVTILRANNVALVYDENDFTIVNFAPVSLNYGSLTFYAVEGNASFAASRWGGAVESGNCTQLWSIIRYEAKPIERCNRVERWITTNNTAEHFWTALNGVSEFTIVLDGVERGRCPAAQSGSPLIRCDVYLPVGATDEATEYIYFAYTTDALLIKNPSPDRWMPLARLTLFNNNPNLGQAGAPIAVSDPLLYGANINAAASVANLAPSQCVLFVSTQTASSLQLPEACDVVARLDVDPTVLFWAANFEIGSTDSQRRMCAAATPGHLTICIMPR